VTKTLVVKCYTNEILNFKTISIWIIYKNLLVTFMNVGSKFFKMYQNHDIMLAFLIFLYLILFHHVKTHLWMNMMESNFNGLKYGTYEIFDIFLFICFYGDQNIREKRIVAKTRPFLSLLVHLKGFSPCYICLK